MQNKLQELTDKLYNEGLSKGRKEAEDLKERARKEADAILASARAEADEILASARKAAEELKGKVENDLRLASTQTISSIRHQVEETITTRALKAPIQATLSDNAFIASVITTIVDAFNAAAEGSVALELILPVRMQEDLKTYLGNQLHAQLGNGSEIHFSRQIDAGFKIGPKDGGYLLSFTDEDFERLLTGYLRPVTRQLLFG